MIIYYILNKQGRKDAYQTYHDYFYFIVKSKRIV